MDLARITAIAIFVAMFAVIVSGRIHRTWAALGSALLTAIIVLRSPAATFNSINWETIIFLGGMMVMVAGLGLSGFFRWLCLYVARLAHYNTTAIFISFMVLSGFLAMFIDSITVLLFMAAVVIELSYLMGFKPMPFIIALIFAANTGGAATMSGDPPNVIIGTAFGYSFMDFATNTGPIAWVGLLVGMGFLYFTQRHLLAAAATSADYPEPRQAITDRPLFSKGVVIFLIIIAFLVSHHALGQPIHVVGITAAVLTFIAAWRRLPEVFHEVDWPTLLFFLGLFVVVGGLEETHVLQMVADSIGDATGGELALAIAFILWFSAFASAIVDNIPFAAAMVPVIRGMSATLGMDQETLSWTLALGADIGGNATPIGASANVVGLGVAERMGIKISWGYYLLRAVPATILALIVFHILLLMRYT
ncbi:MAG: SLC13 family permease [Dehalococcoidia bacterium]|jgi:Na+/H+ antiporter NhaD/arsenite permease-like protein|nr:SLC13 family permease [Dehalococcoidia bacterium]MDP6782670.1 SLC13 family permease [Dehalococcoidia bacterium]